MVVTNNHGIVAGIMKQTADFADDVFDVVRPIQFGRF
jgi:hypothetical protein